MSAIQPGWYKDPADPSTQRWWDGEGWIGDAIPADLSPPIGPPVGSAPAAATPPARSDPRPMASPPATAGPSSTTSLGAPSGAPGMRPEPMGWAPGTPGPRGGVASRPIGWPAGVPYPMAAPRPHGMMLASPGSRFVARMVDILAVLVLSAIANAWFAISFWRTIQPFLDDYIRWSSTNPTSFNGIPRPPQQAGELLLLMCFVITAVWFAYEVPATANSGQTLGKKLLGIKVVAVESDERLGFGRSFRRWFRLGLPTLFWTVCGGLTALLQVYDCLFVVIDRPLRQALHDKGAHTVVVQLPRAGRPETARTPSTPHESTTGGRHADPR